MNGHEMRGEALEWVHHPFKRFDKADRSRSRVLRMWAFRRSTSLKSLADTSVSPAFFASYLIRIASHHFNKMTQVLTLMRPEIEILNDTLDEWTRAINEADANSLAELFHDEALFMGSEAQLLSSREQIAAYYSALPAELRVAASVAQARVVSEGVIAGFVNASFFLGAKPPRNAVISLLLSNSAKRWCINSYHLRWL